MATAPEITSEAQTSIIVAVHENPAMVLIDAGKRDDLYAHIRREVAEFVPDLTTLKGREAIKSFAFKITRTKTAIDDAGKRLNEDARTQINVIDAARRDARDVLETLAKEVRRPLTEWEDAEKARVEHCRAMIDGLKAMARIEMDDTAAMVRERGSVAYNTVLTAEEYGDMLAEAHAAKDATVATLKAALARLTQEETDRAELERLRTEKAEKEEAQRLIDQRRDYARRVIEHIHQCGLGMIDGKTYPYIILIRELEEKIAVSEEDFGDMAGDVEKARVETLARVKEAQAAQAERSRKEVEEAAGKAAREEVDKAHAEALAAEKRRADEADAARKAEADRIARETAAKEAEEKRLASEQAARDADQKHRTAIKTAAKEAMIALGCPDDTAVKIVLAIIAGDIPNVTLRF